MSEIYNANRHKDILSEDLLWPFGMAEKLTSGFIDEELELICDWGLRGYDESLPYKSSRWIYWPVELYSFGRCYRDWLNLPTWLPLPLYGDHGVTLSGILSPHEVASKPKIHITWSGVRANNLRKFTSKKILHVPHPWIMFRRKYGLKKKDCAKGTLIFSSHSNTGIEIFDYDYEGYFSSLRSLPEQYHPLVICMHRHDIEKKYHIRMRKYGLPIISAGETSSPYFVERFYSMISRFEYCTSNSGGSELFYCHEFGSKYFIFGQKPQYVNSSNQEINLGLIKPCDDVQKYLSHTKEKLFSTFPPTFNDEKTQFVNSVLGLNVDENASRQILLSQLKNELRRHATEVICLIAYQVLISLIPRSIKSKLKNIALIIGVSKL